MYIRVYSVYYFSCVRVQSNVIRKVLVGSVQVGFEQIHRILEVENQSCLTKKPQQSVTSEWFTQPWAKLIGVITTASVLAGGGYWFGTYSKGIQSDLDQIKLRQEFHEKIQREISDCQKDKIERYEVSLTELKNIVETIRETQNARKK